MEDPFPELPDPQLEGIEIRYTSPMDGPLLKEFLADERVNRWLAFRGDDEVDKNWRIWMNFAQHRCAITAILQGKIVGFGILFPWPYQRMRHQATFSIVISPEVPFDPIAIIILRNLMYWARERFRLEFLHIDMYKGCPLIPILQQARFECCGRQDKFILIGDEFAERTIWQKRLTPVQNI